jgi:hypothetical protein
MECQEPMRLQCKSYIQDGHQYLTSVILATLVTEIKRMMIQSQLEQKVWETPISTNG